MTKKLDDDVKALKAAIKALDQSTSRRMLIANLEFFERSIHQASIEATASAFAE